MSKPNLFKRFVVPDTLSKTIARRYFQSSSFTMAGLFTLLLGVCILLLAYLIYDFGQDPFIQTNEPLKQRYLRLQWFSAVTISVMAIVVLISFFISGFVVRRINRISATAWEIMQTGDLSRRIEVDTKWDDLSHLAHTLNILLERIEQLMEGIRDVSDNIAHDLRTPLTRLRHHLEVVREHALSEEQADQLIAEADHLLATFHSLLRIANLEKGRRHQPFQELDLRHLLQDVIELYEPLADESNIAIMPEWQATPMIHGDRDLLFQLFANLLDNAIKFSPPQGIVTIRLSGANHACSVLIADQGPGIAEEEREKVFRRFYRGDTSRHSAGSGLGLSLVKAVLELHHGRISLEDNAPGLRVRLDF